MPEGKRPLEFDGMLGARLQNNRDDLLTVTDIVLATKALTAKVRMLQAAEFENEGHWCVDDEGEGKVIFSNILIRSER